MFDKLQRAMLPLVRWHPQIYEAALRLKDRLRGLDSAERRRSMYNRRVVTLEAACGNQGSVLISLILEPFLSSDRQASHRHTIYWEGPQMAETFLEMGYEVDVIQWTNRRFQPHKKYRLAIDTWRNLERLGPSLGPGCIKILHADAAHWLFHTNAQYRRLFALQQRRGVSLPPTKGVSPNLGIEHADCAVVLGNQFHDRDVRLC